jgi:hypothetical protein
MASNWTIIASAPPINTLPTDNLTEVVQPPLSYQPDGTVPVPIIFGLTAIGVWAAQGSAPAPGSNSGVNLPSGTYDLNRSDNCPWSGGSISISGTSVRVPNGELQNVFVLENVILGEIVIPDQPDSTQSYALTANGGTLVGVVIYPKVGPVDVPQTVGVYGAEARPPLEEPPA